MRAKLPFVKVEAGPLARRDQMTAVGRGVQALEGQVEPHPFAYHDTIVNYLCELPSYPSQGFSVVGFVAAISQSRFTAEKPCYPSYLHRQVPPNQLS
jgi:hypothetical protein